MYLFPSPISNGKGVGLTLWPKFSNLVPKIMICIFFPLYTVFPHIVSVETETIDRRKLFKGGKYGKWLNKNLIYIQANVIFLGLKMTKSWIPWGPYTHCVAYICAVWPVYEVKCLCSSGRE